MENARPKHLANLVHHKLKVSRQHNNVPELTVLEQLFDCLFFTSMCREESDLIKVTVTMIDPAHPDPKPPLHSVPERWSCIPFAQPIKLSAKSLAKLSKAADPRSTTLAVYYNDKGLFIWGMIDQAMHYENFLNYESDTDSEQPGLFQVSIDDIGTLSVLFDYQLLATLKQHVLVQRYLDVMTIGPISKILRQNATILKTNIRDYLNTRYPDCPFSTWEDFLDNLWIQTLSRLLLKIQHYQHGGAILINTDQSDLDIKYQIFYERLPKAMIAHAKACIDNAMLEAKVEQNLDSEKRAVSKSLYHQESSAFNNKAGTANEITGAITFIASQTCVDGVVLFDTNLAATGFGTVLRSKRMPRKIYLSTAATASTKSLMPADPKHYGTRHRSMIAYCWNHPQALGMVISQDGDIRAFKKIDDKLIMWENIKTRQYANAKKRQ
ncbi:MAG: hypothetical protein EOP54_05580 [Sphingobacteriales bacterium]|nr:MAG: hypothetical protein EOP54_05580 [Sphingobacteriales bacterium]